MIDARQLIYFTRLARLQNFSRVAEEQHVTQAAVSQQIRRLERVLGVRLFVRTPRGTTPTEEGAALLPRAQSVLEQMAVFEQEADALARGAAGVVRLGSPINAARSRSRQLILTQFGQQNPGVETTIENGWTAQLVSMLRDGELDLVFLNMSLDDPHTDDIPAELDDLEVRLVEDAPSTLLASRGSDAWLQLNAGESLRGLPILMYPEALNPWMYHQRISVVERSGAKPVLLREASLPAVLEEVREGRGIFPAIPWEISGLDAGVEGIGVHTAPDGQFRSNLWLARLKGTMRPVVRRLLDVSAGGRRALAKEGNRCPQELPYGGEVGRAVDAVCSGRVSRRRAGPSPGP